MGFRDKMARVNDAVLRHLGGDKITYTDRDGKVTDFDDGLFEEQSEVRSMRDGIEVVTLLPVVWFPIEGLTPRKGESIVVDNRNWTIGHSEPDGTGLVMCTLDKV